MLKNVKIKDFNMNRFFKPYVGKYYSEGINGKRVLVIGNNFPCENGKDSQNCPYHEKCTDTILKDSSCFNTICPKWHKLGYKLEDQPFLNMDESTRAYKNFADGISEVLGKNDFWEIWECMAFTNYVQFMVPKTIKKEAAKYLSERDFDSFLETIDELEPDIIVIWGSVINTRLKERNKYVYDANELYKSDCFVCHMQYNGKNITLINCDHPSPINRYSWNKNLLKFQTYLKHELAI